MEDKIAKRASIKTKKIKDMVNSELCKKCTRYNDCPMDYECDFLRVAKKITIKTLEIVLRDEIEHLYDNEPCEEDDNKDD